MYKYQSIIIKKFIFTLLVLQFHYYVKLCVRTMTIVLLVSNYQASASGHFNV